MLAGPPQVHRAVQLQGQQVRAPNSPNSNCKLKPASAVSLYGISSKNHMFLMFKVNGSGDCCIASVGEQGAAVLILRCRMSGWYTADHHCS
jgi:hypothetical protein